MIPKSLNVARIQRTKLSRSLEFKRVRLQTFNASFDRNLVVYTSRAALNPATPAVVDRLAASVAQLESDVGKRSATVDTRLQQLSTSVASINGRLHQMDTSAVSFSDRLQQVSNSVATANSQITAVSSSAVRRCRVCFQASFKNQYNTGECRGDLNPCSGWSNAASWSSIFVDDTDGSARDCNHQWKLEFTV